MDVQTKGFKTSEFWMTLIPIAITVFLIYATNSLGWEIDQDLKNLLLASIGGGAVYAGGRSHYKSSKIRAMSLNGSVSTVTIGDASTPTLVVDASDKGQKKKS